MIDQQDPEAGDVVVVNFFGNRLRFFQCQEARGRNVFGRWLDSGQLSFIRPAEIDQERTQQLQEAIRSRESNAKA